MKTQKQKTRIINKTLFKKKNSRELYQTTQNNQSQLNQLKTSTLISNKHKENLIRKSNEITNNHSTLQTFGLKGLTTLNKPH